MNGTRHPPQHTAGFPLAPCHWVGRPWQSSHKYVYSFGEDAAHQTVAEPIGRTLPGLLALGPAVLCSDVRVTYVTARRFATWGCRSWAGYHGPALLTLMLVID